MKKFLGLTLSALMVLGLTACSGEVKSLDSLTNVFTSDIQSLDYVSTALAVDHEINANLVDGLLENDQYGKFVGALAESWEQNEDATVWTFKLREGVKWVTSTGDEYGEVKAQDFVTGMQHAADFESGTAYLLEGLVKNYSEYENGKVDFSEVGVKAIDDYTVQYTLNYSAPYFFSITTYAILYPVNQTFLEAQGVGCKLGEPDKETCAFGTVDPASILYNGGYILSENTSESKIVLTANPSYWDADHVYVKTVNLIYDDGSDVYSVINGFEQGTYVQATLSTSWEDFNDYKEKYADNYYVTLPNSACFGINFNYNRQSYQYTSHTTDADKENTQKAIWNSDFRNAVLSAYDRVAYLTVNTPEDVAVDMLRNMNQFPDIVTKSDGTSYTEMVNKYYREYTGIEDADLSDGQDAFLSKENALAYIEKAKEAGIKFPVTLDVLIINDASPVYVNRGNVMKKTIEENTNGQILINNILVPYNTVMAICYTNTDPAKCDYDINTFTGWSPDFADPKSFVDIYSTSNGYYMTTLGLQLDAYESASDRVAKDESGFAEYERLYKEADAITNDLDARYEAYAKADAYLVAKALMVPNQMDARGYRVSKVVPFTKSYSNTGISEYKYKFMKVQEDIVTKEQYDKAKADWDANRG